MSMQVQSRTLWTHQFASGSSIAPVLGAVPKLIYPALCVWTWLFCFQTWFGSLSRTALLGSGVNAGGVSLSAAGNVDRLSKNLWHWGGNLGCKISAPAQQKLSTQKVSLVCAEEKTFLSRGWSKFLEVILAGKEIFKETPNNPCCLVYHMPSIQPTFLLDTCSMFITQLSYSPSPKCYPSAMICPEYLFAQQREKLKMTDTSYVTSCAVERHWKEEI